MVVVEVAAAEISAALVETAAVEVKAGVVDLEKTETITQVH